jgi:CRISPR system Cascade subunit CasC
MLKNNITSKKFIQLHFLTSYPPALLNRDDIGFAKRMPFGEGTRIRVSSQCLKRHWRTHEGMHSLKNLAYDPSIHSRKIFSDMIFDPLQKEFGTELALEATLWMKDIVLGKSKSNQKKEKKENNVKGKDQLSAEEAKVKTELEQIIVLGRQESNYLLSVGREYCAIKNQDENALKVFEKKIKDNLKALGKGAMGLDAALFGRMVTADVLARSDAAIHVSHAFTVHLERVETDYFTAVDDLEKMGSAHINNSELTSNLFYGYVVIDLPLLVSNLTGCQREEWLQQDKTITASVVESLLYLITTVSPGAKQGSTAPYAYSHLLLAEAGNAQPCSLANAFLAPVKPDGQIIENACKKLFGFINRLDGMYGFDNQRCYASLIDCEQYANIMNNRCAKNISDLANWLQREIQGQSNE